MISIVCVYNNEDAMRVALLTSLQSQSVRYELLLLDNRDGRYKSAAQALNEGGRRATGDLIMFVHQDMWLATNTWLEDAEKILRTLPRHAVAGVAGMSRNGRNWRERIRFSIGGLEKNTGIERGPVDSPEEVETLDECVLILPRTLFQKLEFDERTFDGWDCYGGDYCLSARQLGMKAYVLPLPCNHCTSRAAYPIWHSGFKNLVKYQKRLYEKHKRDYRSIYTWTGTVSWIDLKLRFLTSLLAPLYLDVFPNLPLRVKKELVGCETVLDLGCGPCSPIQICEIPFSVGVERFRPSLLESRRVGIHSEYVMADVRHIAFKPKSFDAVIALEVLEHLTKVEGNALLTKMEEWARKKVIVTTPNGFVWQDTYDDNPYQEHKTGWQPKEVRGLGFKVRGVGGWKRLRGYKGEPKYRPGFLWQRISDLTDLITRHFPEMSFGMMAVKRMDRPK